MAVLVIEPVNFTVHLAPVPRVKCVCLSNHKSAECKSTAFVQGGFDGWNLSRFSTDLPNVHRSGRSPEVSPWWPLRPRRAVQAVAQGRPPCASEPRAPWTAPLPRRGFGRRTLNRLGQGSRTGAALDAGAPPARVRCGRGRPRGGPPKTGTRR